MTDNDKKIDFPTPLGDFLTYRANKVVALVDQSSSVKAAIDELAAAGFSREEIDVLSGPEGAERLDVSGERHGLRARVYRLVERLGDTNDWLKIHSEHIAAGGFGVSVSADANTKSKAAAILSSHGAHDAAYFGKAHWEHV